MYRSCYAPVLRDNPCIFTDATRFPILHLIACACVISFLWVRFEPLPVCPHVSVPHLTFLKFLYAACIAGISSLGILCLDVHRRISFVLQYAINGTVARIKISEPSERNGRLMNAVGVALV